MRRRRCSLGSALDGGCDLKLNFNGRGYAYVDFKDVYGQECSLQQSSGIDPGLWIGVDNTGPNIAGPQGTRNEYVSCRMLLNPDQAKALIPILVRFAESGSIQNGWLDEIK